MTIRCDAVHVVRCCSCLHKKDQLDYKPMQCMWSDAALVCQGNMQLRNLQLCDLRQREYQVDYKIYIAFSVVACCTFVCRKRSVCLQTDAMWCMWSGAVLVCTKQISWITTRCDAVHMVRCRSCLHKTDQLDYKPMRCIWSDAMRCIWSDAMLCIWSDAMLCIWSDVGLQTKHIWSDAVHMVRRDAVHMVRCDAVHMVRCRITNETHMVRCDAYSPM